MAGMKADPICTMAQGNVSEIQNAPRQMILTPPRNMGDFANYKIGADSQEDAESSPHLPAHDKGSSNSSWAVLGGKNGNRRGLESHANSQEKSRDQKLLPILGECTTDWRNQANNRGQEDGP